MFKKLKKFWLDFLFPTTCFICQKDDDNGLCFTCLKTINYKEPTCPGCKQKTKLGEFCDKCQADFALKGVLVAGDFNDTNLSKIIKLYKYNFIKKLSLPLGLFLSNFLNQQININPILKNPEIVQGLNINDYLLIPVPLSKKRLRWRGFNQSELIAREINKNVGLKISTELRRLKHRKAQAKLNLAERKNNLKNCFYWSGENLKNKKIIIVDDVCTTGSTLNEIALELKKHQAEEIWGLVLAHG